MRRRLTALAVAFAASAAGAAGALAGPSHPDPTFGAAGGVVHFPRALTVWSHAAFDRQGRIVVAGDAFTEGAPDPLSTLVARYTRNGKLDRSFGGGDGWILRDALGNGQRDFAAGLAVDGANRVLVGVGFPGNVPNRDFAVFRLTASGALDGSYGGHGGEPAGTAVTNFPGNGNDDLRDIELDSQGRVVAGGSDGQGAVNFAVVRYLTNGNEDNSFDGNGIQDTDLGASDHAFAVELDSQGRILLAGTSVISNSESRGALNRFLPSGADDPSFNGTGFRLFGPAGQEVHFADAAIASNGRIVAAGTTGVKSVDLTGFTSTGQNDPGFTNSRRSSAPAFAGWDTVALDRAGRIVTVGESPFDPSVIGGSAATIGRYTASGKLDPGFGGDGFFSPESNGRTEGLAIDPGSGKILVGGQDAELSNYHAYLLRLGTNLRCGGRIADIAGTPRRDRIRGTLFNDVIVGRGGNDVIRGLLGNDRICGQGGRDRLLGGLERDLLIGGKGRDRLLGGPDRDKLRGGPGRDRQRQ